MDYLLTVKMEVKAESYPMKDRLCYVGLATDPGRPTPTNDNPSNEPKINAIREMPKTP